MSNATWSEGQSMLQCSRLLKLSWPSGCLEISYSKSSSLNVLSDKVGMDILFHPAVCEILNSAMKSSWQIMTCINHYCNYYPNLGSVQLLSITHSLNEKVSILLTLVSCYRLLKMFLQGHLWILSSTSAWKILWSNEAEIWGEISES